MAPLKKSPTKSSMLRIEYCADGESVSDFAVEEWFEKAKAGGDFKVSNEIPIIRVRVAVNEGALSREDVLIVFRDMEQIPTTNGRLHHWPDGFCDTFEKLLERLL